jgi:hypothetical protein
VGRSDLDFILDHVCEKKGVDFLTDARPEDPRPKEFALYSERTNRTVDDAGELAAGRAHLGQLLISWRSKRSDNGR